MDYLLVLIILILVIAIAIIIMRRSHVITGSAETLDSLLYEDSLATLLSEYNSIGVNLGAPVAKLLVKKPTEGVLATKITTKAGLNALIHSKIMPSYPTTISKRALLRDRAILKHYEPVVSTGSFIEIIDTALREHGPLAVASPDTPEEVLMATFMACGKTSELPTAIVPSAEEASLKREIQRLRDESIKDTTRYRDTIERLRTEKLLGNGDDYKLQSCLRDKEALTTRISTLTSNVSSLTSEISSLQSRLASSAGSSSELNSLRESLNRCMSEKSNISGTLQDAIRQAEENTRNYNNCQQQVHRLESELSNCEKNLDETLRLSEILIRKPN